MDKIFRFVTEDRALVFARYSLALMLAWFGAMNFTTVGAGIVSGWLSGHMFMAGLGDEAARLAMGIGALQLILGVGLVIGRGKIQTLAALGAAGFSALALTLLIFANVWIDSMGGFPVIGAGQGVIKYVSIMGVSLFIAGGNAKAQNRALLVTLFGIWLVMTWIGGMKFTEIEAAGIEPLLATSPFFSWLLTLFGKMGASYFIGVFEILAVALLALGWFKSRTLFQVGALMCVVTFLGTQSFLITLPGWDETLGGFPALSRSGHFLLKDLVMLAGTLLLVAQKKG